MSFTVNTVDLNHIKVFFSFNKKLQEKEVTSQQLYFYKNINLLYRTGEGSVLTH